MTTVMKRAVAGVGEVEMTAAEVAELNAYQAATAPSPLQQLTQRIADFEAAPGNTIGAADLRELLLQMAIDKGTISANTLDHAVPLAPGAQASWPAWLRKAVRVERQIRQWKAQQGS
jgi:hypothetical protein